MSDYLDVENEELLKDFFAEAEQQVENLESNILVIENDPANHEAVDEIFRAAHTLKGGSATVEMEELASFTHAVEDVLDEIRSDRLKVTEPVIDILLSAIDVIKNMLSARANSSVYSEDITELVAKLHSFVPEKKSKKKSAAVAKPVMATPVVQAPVVEKATTPTTNSNFTTLPDAEFAELAQSCSPKQKVWSVTVQFDENNPMNSVGGIQVFAALKACGTVLKTVPDFDALYEDEFYPTVVYFVATESTGEQLEDTAFLSDVTNSTDAKAVFSESAAPKAAAPVKVQETSVPTVSQEEIQSILAQTQPSAEPEKVAPAPVEPVAVEKKVEAAPKAPAQGHVNVAGSILRVDSRRIDSLLNLVSETVITKAAFNQHANQLAEQNLQFQALTATYKERVHRLFELMPHYLEEIENGTPMKKIQGEMTHDFSDVYGIFDTYAAVFKNLVLKFRTSTQNLGRITGELQEGVMKIRMVPINQIFSRFPRVVRDLQRDLNKKINLVIEGEDTELDKSVVEDLLDPIMHCVRNSVDHGIESPEERVKSGKPETGTVTLRASNEGNMINIDISDDGAGIDVTKVRAKAIDRGLIHPDKVISDQEAFQLIFLAGFSTSDQITNISGRGVGLDVVKTMIEKLNGTVTVSSEQGSGTTFSIRLPLTMAIIQGLLVRVGKEIYSIPIASVIESRRVHSEEINTIDNYEVLNVRNEIISILRLSRLFNIPVKESSDYCYIVIVGSQSKKIGIMVDALIGEEDVVIKPLRDQFTNSPGIAGASILGDGSVSLIIDVTQLLDLGVRQEIDAQKNVKLADEV